MTKSLLLVGIVLMSKVIYAAAPSKVDSPVRGQITYKGQQSLKWYPNQYIGGRHIIGGGVSSADDREAFDFNYGLKGDDNCETGVEDTCKAVYAVEAGCLYKLDGWGGDSVGQILINHTVGGQQWSSSYLHLIKRTSKSCVQKGERIGSLSDVGTPGVHHLHFAVYGAHGKPALKSVNVLINEIDTDRRADETLNPIVNLILDDSRSTPRSDSINIEDLPSIPYIDENGVTYTDRIVFQSSSEIASKKAHGATYLTSASEQWVVCPGSYGPAGITVYSAFSSRRNFIRNPNTGEWARDTTSPAFRSPYLEVDYTVPLYDLTFDVIFNGIFNGTTPSEPKPPCVLPTKTVVFGAVLFDQNDVDR